MKIKRTRKKRRGVQAHRNHAATQHVDRVCLRCGNNFPSSGVGNRICQDCLKSDDFSAHIEEHGVNLKGVFS